MDLFSLISLLIVVLLVFVHACVTIQIERKEYYKTILLRIAAEKQADFSLDENEIKLITYELLNFTDKDSKEYDPIFDQKIRKLAPKWFE
jgi:hypothetical protein